MLSIRAATVNDASLLCSLIRELAEYERELHRVVIQEEDIVRDGFGPHPKFRALIADWEGKAAGYALFFTVYSTWQGKPGLFLEDIFVRPAFRKKGVGTALLARVARLAQDEHCYGIRWEVLDWNQPAISLYESLGAKFLDQWRSAILSDGALKSLAGQAP
jgi:GNAT superfamily N-acetyltransferase